MAVPEQIRKQSEDIQKLYAQMHSEDEEADNSADDSDAAEKGTVEATESDNSNDDATSSTASEHGGSDGEDDYAQKYRTLQGMFNSQVPALKAENRELGEKVANLEKLIASLQTETKAGTDKGETPEVPQRLVTNDEIEEYGESIEVMRKVTREELGTITSKIKSLEAKIEAFGNNLNTTVMPQVQSVAKHYQRSTSENFWSKLSGLVPDWQNTNNDPDFHTWLLQVDPLTGATRQSHLEKAQDDFDADRVAAFFTAYKQLAGTVDNTNARSSRSASELEKQVAPGRSRGTSKAAGSSEATTYTPAQIEQFYSDVRKGAYKGREKERDRIERDIFSAQQEGRIVPNLS